MNIRYWLLVLAVCLGAAPLTPPPTADEVIQKHIEARGGYDALKAIQTQKVESIARLGDEDIALTVYLKRPSRLRIEQVSPEGGKMVRAVNEHDAWVEMDGQIMERPPYAATHQREAEADIDGVLVDYADKGHAVEWMGEEEVEGARSHKLKVTLASGAVQFIYLDAQTYLTKKDVRTILTPGGDQEVTSLFDDYKAVEGLMVAHRITLQSGGQTYTREVKNVEFNLPLDDTLFE